MTEPGYDINRIETDAGKIVFDSRVLKGCNSPYEDNPDGCPQKKKCHRPSMKDAMEKTKKSELIVLFVVKADFARLREHYGGHLNQRWWQGRARTLLKDEINKESRENDLILGCGSWDSMEAAGILIMDFDEDKEKSVSNIGPEVKNVTRGTFSKNGVRYEWPAAHFATMIAMLAKQPRKPTGLMKFAGRS